MIEMGPLQKQVEDGRQAEILLENPVFKEAAEKVRANFAKAFKGDDEDKALEARRQIRVFEAFLTEIVAVQRRGITAGKEMRKFQQRQNEGLSTEINDMKGIA